MRGRSPRGGRGGDQRRRAGGAAASDGEVGAVRARMVESCARNAIALASGEAVRVVNREAAA
ncbi:hypothetical protein [Amycolatopsis thermoflava]